MVYPTFEETRTSIGFSRIPSVVPPYIHCDDIIMLYFQPTTLSIRLGTYGRYSSPLFPNLRFRRIVSRASGKNIFPEIRSHCVSILVAGVSIEP